MKRNPSRLALLLSIILFITSSCKLASGPEEVEQVPAIPRPVAGSLSCATMDTGWENQSIFRRGLVERSYDALELLPQATEYHINILIPGDISTLQGCQAVRYTNRETQPLEDIYFNLFPNIQGGKTDVTQVWVNKQEVTPTYVHQDSALQVPLPTPLQPGEEAIIEMNFTVDIARQMAGNYGLFGYFDDVLVLDGFYPSIPVYDDEGWNVQDSAPNGDMTNLDASFYLVKVTAPVRMNVIASGAKARREILGNYSSFTFAAGPARDFYVAASENFVRASTTVGETTINSYTFPENTAGTKAALEAASQALGIFNQRLDHYPYTELDIVSTPMLALGIEYPGIVGISLDLYALHDTQQELSPEALLEGVVVHEVSHQWFYNVIGNDQVDEPWLDEAMAQYLTMLYYTDVYGDSTARSYRSSWTESWSRIDQEEIPIGLPAGDYTSEQYQPVIYGRGPLFLMALAEVMGEKTFHRFLRDYYDAYKWETVTTEIFHDTAEQYCRCELDEVFDKWVYPAD